MNEAEFIKNAREEIQKLLNNPPSSWKSLFLGAGLSETPSIDDVVNTFLEFTAGGKDAGERGDEVKDIPLAVRQDALKGVKLSHKANYPSYNGIGLTRGIQLATQKTIYARAQKRMCAFFKRNKRYLGYACFGDDENPCKSYMAWLNWGGTPGYEWSCDIKL